VSEKEKEYLQKDYIKLKNICRDLVWMTHGTTDKEEHYDLVKMTIPAIREALEIMKQLIEEEQCIR